MQLPDCHRRVDFTALLTHCYLQVSEGRILAALQDEVTAAEARLEEERAAHVNTQRSAAARDQVR